MPTKSTNRKSQSLTIRVPLETMTGMAKAMQEGESNTAFVVSAINREITQRQLEQNGGDALANLNSALDTLANIEAASTKAGKELREIASAARQQLQQLRPGSEPPAAEAPKPIRRPDTRKKNIEW
ncbi:YlcI/YnfO family protein [Enterobacter mori]|uniref:YlcI/YnfO family protein n=1 Tax=Enterobacter mori TaxID=539813 RepID=UPI003B844884